MSLDPLPAAPDVSDDWHRRLRRLLEETATDPPPDLPSRVLDKLGIDLTARYAGAAVPHPFGKASGQLSQTTAQVRADVDAGMAFVVLKTVIAEDESGRRSMGAWAIDESRMRVEQRVSRSGRQGWTVTWRGRGWPADLEAYCAFLVESLAICEEAGTPLAPSVKYHLPTSEPVNREEYAHTTALLLDAWRRGGGREPMPLEKDFSPTLAGDHRSDDADRVLAWVKLVPRTVGEVAGTRVALGMKLMNALFDDAFQIKLLRTARESTPRPAYLAVFNRLFDPIHGTAFGGWDLSDRNFRVIEESGPSDIPLSATGNICSGRVMVEYARRGCENGQVHTFFQVPLSEYTATGGSRSARAVHTLILHPTDGLAVWLRHLYEAGQLDGSSDSARFLDCVGSARRGPC